jgi:hypothetical protein
MGLRDKAKSAVDETSGGARSWLKSLPPKTAEEVLGVIDDFHAGKLPGLRSARAVARWIKKEVKIDAVVNTVAEYIMERRK